MAEALSPKELEHYTNYWCRTLGIHSKDLTTHPQIDDVIMLIKFLEEFLQDLRGNNRIAIYIIWNWVYIQRKPLTKRYCKRLTRIGNSVIRHRHFKQQQLTRQRNKIKALSRTLP